MALASGTVSSERPSKATAETCSDEQGRGGGGSKHKAEALLMVGASECLELQGRVCVCGAICERGSIAGYGREQHLWCGCLDGGRMVGGFRGKKQLVLS